VWPVLGLWALIDVAALCIFALCMLHVHAKSGPADDDVALVIIYTPVIWPMIWINHLNVVSAILDALKVSPDFQGATGVLTVWVETSLLVALPSGLSLFIVRAVSEVRRNQTVNAK
jgi:hypothetical protein